MKNFIIIGANIVLLFAGLTSCKKAELDSETAPETGTHVPSSSVAPYQRYLRMDDTEDRPKMVKGHIQNSAQSAVPYAPVSMHLVSDNSKVGDVTADAGGDFEIDSIYGGEYYLKITATGYNIKFKRVDIPLNEDSLFDVGDITLISQ